MKSSASHPDRSLQSAATAASGQGGRATKWPALCIPAAFVVIAALTYLNADHQEFLFDSRHGGIVVPDITQALRSDLHDLFVTFWRPGEDLARVTFRLNALLNGAIGLDPFDVTGFLAVNIIIHALNAWLVYLLVLRLAMICAPDRPRSAWIALVSAALFLVHPLQASSVAYIIQRRGALSTTFFLLAVLAYLSARESRGQRYLKVLAACACYWLSIKSKFLGLPLPFMILMLEFCLRAPHRALLRPYLAILVPGLAVSAAAMLLFAWSHGVLSPSLEIEAYTGGVDWTAWQNVLTESRVFLHYWKLLILPLPAWMCIDHRIEISRQFMDHAPGLLLILQVLLLAGAVQAARRHWMLAAVGIFWFYVALIPYAVLPQSELFVEYKTYLPSIGFVLVVAEILYRLSDRFAPRQIAGATGAVALVLLGVTIGRNGIYHSSIDLWSDAVAKYPTDPRMNLSLAYSYWRAGKAEQAGRYYDQALQVAPGNGGVQYFYANYLRRKGDLAGAIGHYQLALASRDDIPRDKAHAFLGQILQGMGRNDEAVPHLVEALKLNPADAGACYALGNARLAQGDRPGALAQFARAVELNPAWPEAQVNLGSALLEAQRPAEAIPHYERALSLKPNDANTRMNLAYALMDTGRGSEAAAQLREVLRLDPANTRAAAELQKLGAASGR